VAGPHPVAELLRLLADCESSGSLHIHGAIPGVFRLLSGTVVAVAAAGAPPLTPAGAEGGDEPARFVDTVAALMSQRTLAVPQFHPEDEATDRPGRSVAPGRDAEQLLEAVRRVLDRIEAAGLAPEDTVVRVGGPTARAVRVDPVAWSLIGALDRPRTVWEHAVHSGRRLAEVVEALAGLVDQGPCRVLPSGPDPVGGDVSDPVAQLVAEAARDAGADARAARTRADAGPVVPSREPGGASGRTHRPAPRPAPEPAPGPAPQAEPDADADRGPTLPRRRPGVTIDLRDPVAVAPSGGLSASGAFENSTPDLLQRLLAGLHRL
jgi:hypothetical protein